MNKKLELNLLKKDLYMKTTNILGAYQAGREDSNMVNIPNLAETFGVTSGVSDHTLGTADPVVTTTLGIKLIEKYFILNKSIDGSDADFSLDKKEFEEIMQVVRDAEKLLDKIDYSMTEKKKKSRQFSRSLYIVKDIKKVELFIEENVRPVRPGYGLHPKYLKDVLGKTSDKNYDFGR